MKVQHGIVTSALIVAAGIFLSGCGTPSNQALGAASGTGQHQPPATHFQPTLQFKTNPAVPKAGKSFTMDISFNRPAGIPGGSGATGKGGTKGATGNTVGGNGYGYGGTHPAYGSGSGNYPAFANGTSGNRPWSGRPWGSRTANSTANSTTNSTTNSTAGGGPFTGRPANGTWQGPGGGGAAGSSNSPSSSGFTRQVPAVNATLTGGSVNETVPFTFQQGQFTGTTTLSKTGSYTLSVTMTLGSQTIQKQFTFKVQ